MLSYDTYLVHRDPNLFREFSMNLFRGSKCSLLCPELEDYLTPEIGSGRTSRNTSYDRPEIDHVGPLYVIYEQYVVKKVIELLNSK